MRSIRSSATLATAERRAIDRLGALLALLALLALAACGGGGGGDAGAAPPPAVSLAPVRLETQFVRGDEAWVGVRATAQGTLSGNVVARIVDTAGVIRTDVRITQSGPSSYEALIPLNSALTAGLYEGSLQLQLCKDASCTEQHPGSPVAWPYSIRVDAGINTTPLQPLAGAVDWISFQGSFGHGGFAPVTLDASRFSRRWTWVPPLGTQQGVGVPSHTLQAVAVSQGRVFASTSSNYLRDRLFALDESSGGLAWQSQDLTQIAGRANPPSVMGSRVVLSISNDPDTALKAFDAQSGAPLYSTPFFGQFQRYYAPVAVGGRVLSLGGYSGGLIGFDTVTGANAWSDASYLGYGQSTPAADDRFAYALVARSCNSCDDAGLGAIDPQTGALSWRVPVPGIGYANSDLRSAPVVADGVVYLFDSSFFSGSSGRQMLAFSVASRSLLWRATGEYQASPVVGNGVVYAALGNPERVEARSATTGALLWTWSAPTTTQLPAGQAARPPDYDYVASSSRLLLVNNLLFYSSSRQVLAIDLTSRAVVWSFPRPGDLAMSAAGTLFISSSLGPGLGAWLSAVNLR